MSAGTVNESRGQTVRVRLLDVAHARSGDKGDTANVGLIALEPRWYVSNGVVVELLTKPAAETVREYRLGKEPRVLSGSDVLDLSDVLPSFTLVVGDLFAVLTE